MDTENKIFFEENGIKTNSKDGKRYRFFIAVFTVIIVFVLTVFALTPKKYELSVGSIMPVTINAYKKIEDKILTDEVRNRVADQVSYQYLNNLEISINQIENAKLCFDSIVNARNYAYTNTISDSNTIKQNILNGANDISKIELTSNQLIWCLEMPQEELLELFSSALKELSAYYTGGIYEWDVAQTKSNIITNLQLNDDEIGKEVLELVLEQSVRANMLYDEFATNNEREKAKNNVEPIYYQKGQAIAYKGETLNDAQYNVLKELGHIGKGYNFDFVSIGGILIIVVSLFSFYYMYMLHYLSKTYRRIKYFALANLIIVLTVAACVFAMNYKQYFMPIALAGMLSVALINRKVAVMNNLVVCGIVGLVQINNWNNYSTFVLILSIVIGIYIYDKKRSKFSMITASCAMALCSFALNISYILIAENNRVISYKTSLFSVVMIAVSTIFCLGLTILFEGIFNVLTPAKLMDLSNTDNKLLNELINKAPGTYQHSVVVANLAEGAAKSIGADQLFAKVSAYYHDIGKLENPMYFKENQNDYNIHDSLDPIESAKIITNHTVIGAKLAQKERLPVEIRDIILQHHGTTYAKFFYDKAIDMGIEFDENDFIYKGPKPQTKVAGIIMLADTLEAVMRLSYDVNKSSTIIKNVIQKKIKDGQLDECDLTFKDIVKISKSFEETFKSIYHKRIEYKNNGDLLKND